VSAREGGKKDTLKKGRERRIIVQLPQGSPRGRKEKQQIARLYEREKREDPDLPQKEKGETSFAGQAHKERKSTGGTDGPWIAARRTGPEGKKKGGERENCAAEGKEEIVSYIGGEEKSYPG